MTMHGRLLALMALLLGCGWESSAQADSVDVTFRYQITGQTLVSVPGEFNGWTPANGRMVDQGGGLWTRTVRLRLGGNPSPPPPPIGVPGAWQYKFWYNGITSWPNDPLNHHVNPNDNNNTFLYIKDPTIYHLLPNQRSGAVSTSLPVITAYIFPKVGSAVDTASLQVVLDSTTYTGLGSLYDTATRKLTFTPPAPLADGGHTLILRAGANADTVSFITSVGGPSILPLPPYARHGVTLPSPASNDSTTFRLRVGGNSYVVVRIAPAGQPVASAPGYFLRKNTTTDDWWINLPLAPGTYEYLFQTSTGALIYDPWSRYSGIHGSRFTIGPEGLTADDYVWSPAPYERPPLNKLVVYEMNVSEFAGGYYNLPAGQAGFTHLTTLMGYLDSLGVNAIELMPINDYGGMGRSGFSWGYDISQYFALEPAYGTPREFKTLVDSAHAHGIAVIIDAVFNHQNEAGPLWQMQPNEATNPYFKLCNDLRYNEDNLCFFKDMDHWTPETQELVYESIKMWLDVYKVDGFRYDYTQGIGWNIGEPTMGILGWSNRIATEYGNAVYQIAEHLPESPALIYHSGMTGGWHDSFRDKVFDEARFGTVSLVEMENLILDLGAFSGNDTPALPNRYANRTEPVNANVTHDEQSLIYEMVTFQGVPLATAIQRDKLYAPFMFTSLGIPMLWEGMEMSAPRGWTSDGQKLSYRPVEWNLLPTPRGQSHYQYYQALIRQRTHNPALFNGTLSKLARYGAQKVLVWGYADSTSGAKFMTVANFLGSEQTVTDVPWLGAGDWYNIWDQSVFAVGGATVPSIVIPAYTALCYSNLPDSVLLDVRERPGDIPTDFALAQNYPNPFNPSTTIQYGIPAGTYGRTSLRVYDVLGREVATLVNEVKEPGTYSVQWNSGGVASGVYMYTLQTAGPGGVKRETRKMMLLR
jgi:1,4-alpha-glucan branching enzyme